MASPATFIFLVALILNTTTAADPDDPIVAFLTADIATLPTGPPVDFRDLTVLRQINQRTTSFLFDTYNLFYDEIIIKITSPQKAYVVREYPTSLSYDDSQNRYFVYLILQQLNGDNFRAFSAYVRKVHPDIAGHVTINSETYIIEYAPHILTDVPEDNFFANSIYFNNYTSTKITGRSSSSTSTGETKKHYFWHNPEADSTLHNPDFTEITIKLNYTITTFSDRQEIFDGVKSGNISLDSLPQQVIEALVQDFGDEKIGNNTSSLAEQVKNLPPAVFKIPKSNSSCSDCIPVPIGDEELVDPEFEIIETPSDIVDLVELPMEVTRKAPDSPSSSSSDPNNGTTSPGSATPTGQTTFIINIYDVDNRTINNIAGVTNYQQFIQEQILEQAAQQCPSTCTIVPKQPNSAGSSSSSQVPTDEELLAMFLEIQSEKLDPGSLSMKTLAALVLKYGQEPFGISTFEEFLSTTLKLTFPRSKLDFAWIFPKIHFCSDMDMLQLLYHTTNPKAKKLIHFKQAHRSIRKKPPTRKIVKKRIKLACSPKTNQLMWFSYNLQLFKRKIKKPYKITVNLPKRRKRSLTAQHQGLMRFNAKGFYPLGFMVGAYLGGNEAMNAKIFRQAQRWLIKDTATSSSKPEDVFFEQTPNLTFIGLSKCSLPTQLSVSDLEAAADAEQLARVYMKALRTDCNGGGDQFNKLYVPAINAGCLRVSSSGKYFEIPETCKLLSTKKLRRMEQIQLKTAFEVSAFSKTYFQFLTDPSVMEDCLDFALKKHTHIVSPSTACFINTVILNTIFDAEDQTPIHSALISRWLRALLLSSRAALYTDLDALKCDESKDDYQSCKASLKRIQGQQTWLAEIQDTIFL